MANALRSFFENGRSNSVRQECLTYVVGPSGPPRDLEHAATPEPCSPCCDSLMSSNINRRTRSRSGTVDLQVTQDLTAQYLTASLAERVFGAAKRFSLRRRNLIFAQENQSIGGGGLEGAECSSAG